ncbi:MAG: amidohydrolase [Oscillospiraceae bacterium]
MIMDKNTVANLIKTKADKSEMLAKQIWEYAELNFREKQSADLLCSALKDEGFTIETPLCGINTAFCASYGSGGPVIAYLGEYDALSGLSQKAATAQKCPVNVGAPGHGCGHNLLGAGSFAAAAALKDYIVQNHINATVKFFGCPAEEDGSGKTYMAQSHCFDDASAVFTWHPSVANYTAGTGTLAVTGILYSFEGVAAHAAANPFAGRSALDACELMNVGCNYLREHIIPEARLHYAYRDVGGTAPNVVQASASVHYYIRAPHVAEMLDIAKRVLDVAKGAALMTGTKLKVKIIDGVSDYLPNKTLSTLLNDCMAEVGAPQFDENDYALAAEFANTIDKAQRDSNLSHECTSINTSAAYFENKILHEDIPPLYYNLRYAEPGSTDVGDVSCTAPTAQCYYACMALGTGSHSWQMTAQANSPIAMKGMHKASEALLLAGIKAIASPQLLKEAKAELAKALPNGYSCPMPKGTKPEFN